MKLKDYKKKLMKVTKKQKDKEKKVKALQNIIKLQMVQMPILNMHLEQKILLI